MNAEEKAKLIQDGLGGNPLEEIRRIAAAGDLEMPRERAMAVALLELHEAAERILAWAEGEGIGWHGSFAPLRAALLFKQVAD